MRFEFSANSLDQISSDAAVVFSLEDRKDKTFTPSERFKKLDEVLGGQLTKVAKLEKFRGKRGEMLTVIPDLDILPSRILLLGLGPKEEFVADDLRRACGLLSKKMKNKLISLSFELPVDLLGETGLETISQVVAEGLLLGSYEFGRYKKREEEHTLESIIISEENEEKKSKIYEAVKLAELYSKATTLARDLVNGPASDVTPTYLADMAAYIADAGKNIKCRIIDKKEAEELGMNAFLAVARGAETPPKFIHLEYTPENPDGKKKVALIGKGITFDSGGMSIKPAGSMETMKCDMSGAALVLAVFFVISQIKPDFSVMGIIAATPNLISGGAVVPGDVVKAMNGKTIEILNTDAEGRVTMADSLSYAVKEGATEILDFATLTGACMVALGPDIAGLFVNRKDLGDRIKSSAHDAGEKVWEMPLEKDYKAFNKSDIADVANISKVRYGGAITAALFLSEFVEDRPWAHLDIAGPAFIEKPGDIGPKGGSGMGVRTVLNFLRKVY